MAIDSLTRALRSALAPIRRVLRSLGLSRFSSVLAGFHPLGVEDARLVDALVGVRTEEIALGLEQDSKANAPSDSYRNSREKR